MKESIILPPDARESGIKVRPPQGCEIDEVKVVDGFLTVTFKEKERELPKSWEEFCEMSPIKAGECYIDIASVIIEYKLTGKRRTVTRRAETDPNIFPDLATAEAVIALCQLIQLRDCYNGDWVPDYKTADTKFTIEFENNRIVKNTTKGWPCILIFKSEDLRDEFLRNFRPLIEKLKPLYGIKEGGEE